MLESVCPGCDSCGLWRHCVPRRIAQAPERLAPPPPIRRVRIESGKSLYRSGEKIESLYMIRSGCIKEVDDSSGRSNSIINFVLPGEMLGIEGLNGGTSTTSSIAVETSNVCAIPRSAFDTLRHSPDVVSDLLRLLARSSSSARQLVSLIRDRDALERVAGFLLNLSARLQLRGADEREFQLSMSRDDIASYLGLRSETVSRCFSELDRRGLIGVRAKRVENLHADELRRMLEVEQV